MNCEGKLLLEVCKKKIKPEYGDRLKNRALRLELEKRKADEKKKISSSIGVK